MKRTFYFLIMTLCGVLGAAARVYEVKTGSFTKLIIPDNLQVVYTCDPERAGTAHFECEDTIADALMFSRSGSDKLKVQISPDFIGQKLDLPVIYVYSEFLVEVESSSNEKVTVKGLPRCAGFKATIFNNGVIDLQDIDMGKLTARLMTGHGTINISGKADEAVFSLAGTGTIDASRAPVGKVSCHVFGGGQIYCHPLDEIKLKGLGSTTVYYSGKPATVKKQGIGKLVHVGD